jgi:vacuole morphology and inheritance protein 14
MLAKRIYVNNAECRKFLVSWIMVLDAVPKMDLVQYLPHFLDGLFKMLGDPSDEMRSTVVTSLFELLKEIRHKPAKVDFAALVPILVPQCTVVDQYQHITSLTAMSWVHDTISIGREQILQQCGDLLNGILPCVSHGSQGVEDIARKANNALTELVKTTTEEINVKSILTAVQAQFSNQRVPTRLAALGWVLALHKRSASDLMNNLSDLFPVLIKMLSDPAEDVVRFDLKVLSVLSSDEATFNLLIDSLLSLFRSDRKLLEHRGNLIVRQLALNIPAEKIFRTLSKALETDSDAEFASTVIQILNLILLTATELHEVREKLKHLTDGHQDLFICLYKSWSHNPSSVLSLCLLSQVYKHASDLITKLYEYPLLSIS